MSTLIETSPAHARPLSPTQAFVGIAQPLLKEVPALLEYRAEADPDAQFIPKTIIGFSVGALVMGLSLDVVETLLTIHGQSFAQLLPGILQRFAFMLGIMGVSASLLLVGLKVRADHTGLQLYSRHWLNSIGTGAAFAIMMYSSYVMVSHSIAVNRFLAAGIIMAMLTFPAIAAKWTVGPHKELPRPV